VIRRTLLASLVATALAAAAAPGIDRARVRRSNGRIDSVVASIEAAARSLAGDEAVPAGRPGARRVVTVSLPGAAWDEAAVDAVRLASPAERTLTLRYRIAGGGRRSRTVRLSDPVTTADGGPIELDGGGPHVLALSLRGGEHRRRIVVERVPAGA